jgi:hypothetical protein
MLLTLAFSRKAGEGSNLLSSSITDSIVFPSLIIYPPDLYPRPLGRSLRVQRK